MGGGSRRVGRRSHKQHWQRELWRSTGTYQKILHLSVPYLPIRSSLSMSCLVFFLFTAARKKLFIFRASAGATFSFNQFVFCGAFLTHPIFKYATRIRALCNAVSSGIALRYYIIHWMCDLKWKTLSFHIFPRLFVCRAKVYEKRQKQ